MRSFAILLMALAAALVLNTVLGPLGTSVIDYPVAETIRNQLIGLEIVSVALVAPLSIVAGMLALRGHRAAGVLAFGPAAYTAYMFAQYVLGPEYRTYTWTVLFQLGIFTLGGALAFRAWTLTDQRRLPALPRRRERRYGLLLLALAAFVLSRYLGAIAGAAAGDPIAAEFAEAPTFYWSIVVLDLGIVVPATTAASDPDTPRSTPSSAGSPSFHRPWPPWARPCSSTTTPTPQPARSSCSARSPCSSPRSP